MEKEKNTTQDMEISISNTAEEIDISQGEVAEPEAAVQKDAGSGRIYETNTSKQDDNSVLGSQKAEESGQNQTDSKSLKRAEFEKLIKGDYKEFYEERIKENLSRRFKENSQTKQLNAQNGEIVDMLYDKYNVTMGDVFALKSAIEADDAYLVAQANKRGMSIDDYKYIKRLEAENRKYQMMSSQREAAQKANRAVEKWYAESENLKEVYPDFNIFEESKNKSFVSLIKSGIDIKTAYEVVHHNDIISKIAQSAARDAEIKAAESIKQRAMRPAENGLSSQSSAIIKNDVSKLSAKERAEIAQRVSRGEKITF